MLRRCLLAAIMACACLFGTATAWADEVPEVNVSADGDAARIEGAAYAVEGFQRSQVGSNRAIDEVYYGYTYRLDGPEMLVAVNTADYAVVYVPQAWCEQFGIVLSDTAAKERLRAYLEPLDAGLS